LGCNITETFCMHEIFYKRGVSAWMTGWVLIQPFRIKQSIHCKIMFFNEQNAFFCIIIVVTKTQQTMRKGIAEARNATIEFTATALDNLQKKGFKFVQVKGLTMDKHYDYVDPYFLVLVPMKELPTDPVKKDIYEPIKSELLYKWAAEKNEYPHIVIAKN
jgi:hypothetical protein